MARIAITEQDLRAAMRDRRYWQSGHPEREAYQARVTEGWRALAAAGWWDEGGKACTQVFVRAYERTRNGRREHVDAYTQCRPTGRGEGETRIAQARPEHDGAATAGAIAAPAPRPVVVFVGGMGDAGTRIVREYANRFGGAHSDRETRYFAHDEGARIRRFPGFVASSRVCPLALQLVSSATVGVVTPRHRWLRHLVPRGGGLTPW